MKEIDMRALIAAVLAAGRRGRGLALNEAEALVNTLWLIAGSIVLLWALAFMLNAMAGVEKPSLVIGFVVVGALTYGYTNPLGLLYVFSFGLAAGVINKIRGDASLIAEVQKIFKDFFASYKWVVFTIATPFFFFGTMLFEENRGLAMGLIYALGIAGLCIWIWPKRFPGVMASKFIFWYAVVIIAKGFLFQIPGPVWTKYTGWDPGSVKPDVADVAKYELRKHVRDFKAAKEVNAEISPLDAKFRNGTATAADLAKAEEILNANEAKKSQPKAPVVVPDPVPGVTYALPPVPAGRDSDHVKVPITYRTVFSGPFGFTKHCVYRDGTDRVPPWPDGDIVNCYVHNETGGVLEDITYRFVL